MSARNFHCLMVGRMARDDEMIEGRNVVFINSQREVQFSLKTMSPGPPDMGSEVISCYGNKLVDFGFEDTQYDADEERVRNLERFLAGRLVVFRPWENVRTERGQRYLIADPVAVLPMPFNLSEESFMVPVLFLTGKELTGVEERLMGREMLGPYRSFERQMPLPDKPVIMTPANLYGVFDQAKTVYNDRWVMGYSGALRRLAIDLSQLGSRVIFYENAAFIDKGTYLFELLPALEKAQKLEPLAEAPAVDSPKAGRNTEAAAIAPGRHRKEPEAKIKPARVEAPAPPEPELEFLEQLKTITESQGLVYEFDDLVNLHTGLKVGDMVVLAGMSGIGKSRLLEAYASALGLRAGDDFLMIPVRPTWADDKDLLGYLEPGGNLYLPADNDLVGLLKRAHENPGRLFMVVLDEMNLARPEHYMSQLFSLLQRLPDNRRLRLYNPALMPAVGNSQEFPPEITLGRNVLLAGSVNMDETTYAFSDKVLDRLNIIIPQVVPFTRYKGMVSSGEPRPRQPISEPTGAETFYSWCDTDDSRFSLSDAEVSFLEEVHRQLAEADPQKGVGYRTLRHIDLFLRNLPRRQGQPLIDRATAFDLQVVQRVFPKLRGPQEQMLPLVGRPAAKDEIMGSSLIELMDRYEHASSFSYARKWLLAKSRELSAYGYVS